MSITPNPKKSKSQNGTPIYSENGHVIGHVSNGTFYKVISFEKHLLRQPPAIMFDVSSIQDAETLGAKRAEVKNSDTWDVYTAPIALIWEKPIHKNYGYGKQIGLALREWSKNGNAPVIDAAQKPKLAPDGAQARLF